VTKNSSVHLVDVNKEFENNSKNQLMGNNLFLEHLHPNVFGYFLMARKIANEMKYQNLFKQSWPEFSVDIDSILWTKRGTTPLDLELASLRIKELTSRWPFTKTESIKTDKFESENYIQDLAHQLWKKEITWEKAHVQAAKYYKKNNQLLLSAKEYDALILETPYNVSPYLRAGVTYLQLGTLETAKQRFIASLEIEENLDACKYLGAILLKQNEPAKAISFLKRGEVIKKDDLEIMQNLIVANLMIGELDTAASLLSTFEAISKNYNLINQLKNRLNVLQQNLLKN
jgi:tetratricopeptide (TPR) repeat protein